MKQNEFTTAMPPPHEDTDCHRPAPVYVVRTWRRGDNRYHLGTVFVGDLQAAIAEAEALAAERFGMWRQHRYNDVEIWQGGGHDRRLMVWKRGRLQTAVSA